MDNELLEKVSLYLDNPIKRNKIVDAGYRRCTNSNYTHEERIKEIIDHLLKN